jgi:hypothetical protein
LNNEDLHPTLHKLSLGPSVLPNVLRCNLTPLEICSPRRFVNVHSPRQMQILDLSGKYRHLHSASFRSAIPHITLANSPPPYMNMYLKHRVTYHPIKQLQDHGSLHNVRPGFSRCLSIGMWAQRYNGTYHYNLQLSPAQSQSVTVKGPICTRGNESAGGCFRLRRRDGDGQAGHGELKDEAVL